jgi:hypothetical protein
MRACALALSALLSLSGLVCAQPVLSSSVSGTVRDPTGAAVVGAQVIVRNLANDKIEKTASDAAGAYRVEGLIPGSYEVTAAKYGFRNSKIRLLLDARRQSHADIKLNLADVSETAADAATGPLEALVARIERLEAELKDRSDRQASPREPLLATATTDPGLLPRLPEEPIKTDETKALAANSPPPEYSTPRQAAPPQGNAGSAPPAVQPAPQNGVRIPEPLQSPEPPPAVDNETPFAFGDFTWLNGTPRNEPVLDTKFFTAEIRFDTHYMEDFNQPIDHTIVGSTEAYRSGEVQIEQASVGGDFHWDNVRGRILLMDGLFASTIARNDASSCCPGIGQWTLSEAYRYISEAWGGYHFNVNHGLNVDAGIFVSYIGLFSFYNFDNWTYQPSYVSSNTPWYFNGVRVQWFPTNKLKIEPWFINGWQSYAKYNGHPGLGGQLLWMPKESFKLVANQYGFGQDNVGLPHTERIHTDDSIEVRYYNKPSNMGVSKMAFSLTGDAGCQYGGGVTCTGAARKGLKSSFLGWMLYDRTWFRKDRFALTLGGGEMNNTGRYLTLLPPIDGATAFSGTPYFPEAPGLPAKMWDSTINLQYMPKPYITWWWEAGYRHSDVPYFSGRGGVTPPGGNNLYPQFYTCESGSTSGTADLAGATVACASQGGVWFPDLRRSESRLSMGVMVKF